MTKNKKRKSDVRKLANTEGIGIARATLLNERNRSASATPVTFSELDTAIGWEKNLSWSLDTVAGSKIHVPFTSDAPHVLISGGMLGQRHHMLNAISDGVYNCMSTFVYILTPEDAEGALAKLNRTHSARLNALEAAGLETIADARMQDLTTNGTEYMKRDAWKYFFMLVPELEMILAAVSDDAKDTLRALIAEGRKSGVHVIAYTDGTNEEAQRIFDSASVRSIVMEDESEMKTDYAVLMDEGSPVRVKIVQPPFWVIPDAKW